MSKSKTTIKPEWEKEVERLFWTPFGQLSLLADGYRLSLCTKVTKGKLWVAVYVDGVWKGEWYKRESEMGKKFGRDVCKNTDAMIVAIHKHNHGKKAAAEFAKTKQLVMYSPHHTSARSILQKLRACTSVELIND